MKFVCENCKAKYQIGDDKVAGKTLRMKCRRCGHLIQVSAAVTESSVSRPNPTMPPSSVAPGGLSPTALSSTAISPGGPPRPGAAARAPGAAFGSSTPASPQNLTPSPRPTSAAAGGVPNGSVLGDPRDEDGATVVRESPFFTRPGAAANGVVSGRPPAPRIVPPGRPSSSSMRPAAPPARPSSGGGALASATHGASSSPMQDVAAESNGLAGGFARAMADAPLAPPSSTAGLPTEDWYVGIGGVPLGPVRVSVIREKAQAGVLDVDSLVWREGFDEWIALRTIPGLLEIVEEAKLNRTSRLSSPLVGSAFHPVARTSVLPAEPRAATAEPKTTIAVSSAPTPAPAPANSLPFSLVTPSGRPIEPTPRPTDDIAPGALAATAALTSSAGAAPVAITKDPFSVASPAPLVSEPAPARKRKASPVVWGFVAMCAAFGGVAAWAILFRKPAEVVYVEKTTTVQVDHNGAAPPPPPKVDDTAAPDATTSPDATARPASAGAGVAGVRTSKTAEPGATETAPIDTSGFKIGSTPGPTSDPNKGGAGTGQRSQGEIEGVVAKNKPGTSRCWNKAIDAAPSSAPKSVKVTVSFTVTASGSVSGVSASGGDAYPGLSSCLVQRVSAWQFPPADGSNPVTVPFGFNRQ